MNKNDFNNLKEGNKVLHKDFGICKIVGFVVWNAKDKDIILEPTTKEGKYKLQICGKANAPFLEGDKRLIRKA